jgi:2-methylcitrate dehydratase PrpD
MVGGSAFEQEIPGLLARFVKNLEHLPVSSLAGHSFRTSPEWASLVNGTAARYFDRHDRAADRAEPPSAVLVSTLLAVGEQLDSSGADVLAGFAVGAEVAVRVDRALAPVTEDHWDPDSIIGSIAAAAAAGFLLRLTPAAMYNALGTASSMCGGLAVNRGTDTAALHAGSAARNGVMAAALAARGLTGRGEALLSGSGLPQVLSRSPARVTPLLEGLGEHWEAADVGVTTKLSPCPLEFQAAIDAVLGIRDEVRVPAAQLAVIECHVPPTLCGVPDQGRTDSSVVASSSLQHCIAAAWLDGRAGIAQLLRHTRPEVESLRRRVMLIPRPSSRDAVPDATHEVVLVADDGRTWRGSCGHFRGASRNPASSDELRASFTTIAKPVLGTETCTAADAAAGIAGLKSVKQLTQMLAVRRP